MTKLAGVRKCLALKGATRGHVLDRKLTRFIV